jgi:hypothetical protein
MASSPSSPAMPPPRHRSPTEKTQLLVLARSPCPQRPSLAPAGPHHLRLCATSDPVPSQRPGSRAPQPPGAWEPHAVGAARGPAQVRAVRAAGAGLHPHRERGPQLAPRPRAHQRRRYVCGRAEPASPPSRPFALPVRTVRTGLTFNVCPNHGGKQNKIVSQSLRRYTASCSPERGFMAWL